MYFKLFILNIKIAYFIHELQFKIIISGDNIAHGFRGLCVIYLFDHFSTSLKEIAIEFQQCLSGA